VGIRVNEGLVEISKLIYIQIRFIDVLHEGVLSKLKIHDERRQRWKFMTNPKELIVENVKITAVLSLVAIRQPLISLTLKLIAVNDGPVCAIKRAGSKSVRIKVRRQEETY
jgi:hypothetical protein